MSDMMTFPDTWEEFEKLYGFNDVEEIYTNNSRLIPSFRVKQWLDHLPSVQPEIIRCKDCKHSHMTSTGLVKYCDIGFPEDELYLDDDYFCASAELRGDYE